MRRALAIVVLLLTAAAPAHAARHMTLGYLDVAPADTHAATLDEARSDGARVVRVFLRWRFVATSAPANPTDPADPAYQWAAYDSAISDIRARGLRPLVTILSAPDWAEGPNRPDSAGVGTWRPDAAALGAFAQAAATRYRGKVTMWQIWNEPNLSAALTPQWDGTTQLSAAVYRAMLTASYRGIKRGNRAARVITAGTAPYGDDPGGGRTRPVTFWRDLLCLTPALRKQACGGPRARFDAWSHHPYGIRGPEDSAQNPDDASIPDLGRIARVVRAAVKRRTVLPRRHKTAMVTEFSWDSNPPDPDGVPALTQAHWLEGALYEFWKAGVTTALWFEVRDQAPDPSYAATYQAGTRLLDGTPKPALRAFRFPFATGAPGAHTQVWGLAPRAGRVRLQRRRGGHWARIRTAHASAGRVFTARVPLPRGAVVRARQKGVTSLPWMVGGET